MTKTLHFHFFDAGSQQGESQRWVMCNFWSVRDGKRHVGQSQLVKSEEWPSYRAHIESTGWTLRKPFYGRQAA